MPTRKDYRYVGFRLVEGDDDDIARLMDSVPKGQINEFLKSVLRWYASGQLPVQQKVVHDDAYTQERLDRHEQKLDIILDWMKRVNTIGVGEMAAQPEIIDDGVARLSQEEIEQRANAMSNINWGEWS